jgi:subtilase family serine protease
MRIRKIHAAAGVMAITFFSAVRVSGDDMVRLAGHVPSKKIHLAEYLGPRNANDFVPLAIVLKPRNQAALDELLKSQQDPSSPQYHRYLQPAEFAARFGASAADIQQLSAHFARFGLNVSRVHPNNLVLNVEGPVSAVENAFQVQMHDYRLKSGRVAHAANADPIFPAELAGKVSAVAGLNTFSQRRPHLSGLRAIPADQHASVGDFMTPAKIKTAYGLDTLTQTGSGETIALFELDGYVTSDITGYASFFSLPAPNLQNVLVDTATGAAGNGAVEVTLDIELALALAPAAKIMVYEGPNTDQGVLDTYSKIATDNLAKEVSSSWGASEDEDTTAFLDGENTIFQQMAAQGQSVFAASGDSGAYDDPHHPSTLSVDDPASQPYVTGVGGTRLTLTSANTYKAESAWNGSDYSPPETGGDGRLNGGGGGVSKKWPIPSWQVPVGTSANGESTVSRMVPDVSLDADPMTGYPIYQAVAGQSSPWGLVGGTSCAAPLWAAFTALVNQARVANGLARLGFANPALYQIAESTQGPAAFHDVNDQSTNLNFAATINYDLATGWGTIYGAGLFSNLTSATLPAALQAPGAAANLTVVGN